MFLLTILFLSQQLNTYQLQGGHRQTVQVTQRANQLQHARYTLQSDSEDGDYFQPAAGYETLSQNVHGIKVHKAKSNGVPLQAPVLHGVQLQPANVTIVKQF